MNPLIKELLDILTYCRPANSGAETAMIDKYITPLPGAFRDTFGNWHVKIGESRVLWSSHTDTVHKHSGRQTLHFDPLTQIVGLSKASKTRSNCLGADCSVGVWIMRHMILRGIPGYYVFHNSEEIGGIGSDALAENHADWLRKSFDMAIAFDRRGTGSVITDQGWQGETSSTTFATALAAQLNAQGMHYAPDPRGVFTDTANYAEIIAECTNLSVGYRDEHRPTETLDVMHALALLEAICKVDVSALPIVRVAAPRWPWVSVGKSTRDHDRRDQITERRAIGSFDRYTEAFRCLECNCSFWATSLWPDCPDCHADYDSDAICPEDEYQDHVRELESDTRSSVYLDPDQDEIQEQLSLDADQDVRASMRGFRGIPEGWRIY